MHLLKGAAVSSYHLTLDYTGLVLDAGVKLSLHLKCRVISQLLVASTKVCSLVLKT